MFVGILNIHYDYINRKYEKEICICQKIKVKLKKKICKMKK